MTTGLPVSRVINVSSSFVNSGALAPNTSSVLAITDEDVISVSQRIRSYGSASAVAADFGTSSYAYNAAVLFFSVQPAPTVFYVGRWASAATKAHLYGGALTTAQQALTNFTNITNGGFTVSINGSAVALTGLDFSAQTNLNGVASVIQTALASNGTATFNGSYFTINTATTGGGVAASGLITLTGQPAANDTVTVSGVAITFVASGATGNQVNIGSTSADTAANLAYFLQNSTNTSLTALSYSRNGLIITVTSNTAGTAGNAITLAKSSTNITVSGATLTGGLQPATIGYATAPASGTDISGLLGLTAALAQPPVPGQNAESALAAVQALDNVATYWFACTVVTPTVADSDHQAIAAYIETTQHIYAVSTQEQTALSSTNTNDIGSLLMASGYLRSFVCYSSTNAYSALGFLALGVTVDYTTNNSAITLMFKVVPGMTPETLSSAQANTLTAKHINYYVNYNNGTAITQNGQMAGAAYIDEIIGLTSLTNNIQTNEWNLLLAQPKVPQTDGGMHQLTVNNTATLQQYVTNGFLAPGVWNGPAFGAISQGELLPPGFYVYRAPIATQSTGARGARQAVTAQIAVKLAGAVQYDSIIIQVNR